MIMVQTTTRRNRLDSTLFSRYSWGMSDIRNLRTEILQVRIEPTLKKALEDRAKAAESNASELVRALIDNEIGHTKKVTLALIREAQKMEKALSAAMDLLARQIGQYEVYRKDSVNLSAMVQAHVTAQGKAARKTSAVVVG